MPGGWMGRQTDGVGRASACRLAVVCPACASALCAITRLLHQSGAAERVLHDIAILDTVRADILDRRGAGRCTVLRHRYGRGRCVDRAALVSAEKAHASAGQRRSAQQGWGRLPMGGWG